MKNKFKNGLLGIIGYILSPLSWWNDLFINIPLAYIFALPFSLISKKLFLPMLILGYWITNIAGFILMHIGVKGMFKGKQKMTKRDVIKNIIFSVLYTIIIVIIVFMGWLKFPTEYLIN